MEKLGQATKELMENFKSFLQGSQSKPPIHEGKNIFNSFYSICSSDDHSKELCQIVSTTLEDLMTHHIVVTQKEILEDRGRGRKFQPKHFIPRQYQPFSQIFSLFLLIISIMIKLAEILWN